MDFAAQGQATVFGAAALGLTAPAPVVSFTAQGQAVVFGTADLQLRVFSGGLLLNGVMLPYPDRDGITLQQAAIGVAFRGPVGLTQRVRGVKQRISIRWSLCTGYERTRLLAAWGDCVQNPRLLALLDGRAYTVLATSDFEEQQVYGAEPAYTITLIFCEV